MALDYAVGIPVRNEERTIIRTLTSVLEQTIPPKIIYVCVNGSTDNTANKVADMAVTEKTINLLYSNPGKGNAWNEIVGQCLENVVMFCDGDEIINRVAAENLGYTLEHNPDLVLVGGTCRAVPNRGETFFSRYFIDNFSKSKKIVQRGVSGTLYMVKLKELHRLARSRGVNLMPSDIINEDALLGGLTKGHMEIIPSAYSLYTYLSTFHDWYYAFKRGLAGQKQLRERYPHLCSDSDSPVGLKYHFDRLMEIEGFRRKIGVTSLFLLQQALTVYYNRFGELDYNPVWKETKSTKVEIAEYQ
jgi:glycosyltransferase involved in cell wall biosynthesis